MSRLRPSPFAVSPGALPQGCTHLKLRQLARRVGRHYDAALRAASGLKTSQYSLLATLAGLEPVRPAELAAHMALEPSTLTRNLQPLVAQGWVVVGAGADQRSRLVTLTAAGRLKRQEAQRAWKQAQIAFNQRLGVEQVVRLHALIDECNALLAADAEEDPDHD